MSVRRQRPPRRHAARCCSPRSAIFSPKDGVSTQAEARVFSASPPRKAGPRTAGAVLAAPVVSRQIVEELGGGFVAEASQSGAIVVIDEGVDEGVALGVVGKAVFAGAGGVAGVAVKGFGE